MQSRHRTRPTRPVACGLTRRGLLAGALAAPLPSWLEGVVPALAGPDRLGPARPFSFERLQAVARALAAKPYVPPVVPAPEVLKRIDFDAHQRIRFRADRALWGDNGRPYALQMFHPGRYFKETVAIHVVENGVARELRYDAADFAFGTDHPAAALPGDIGYAGFRLMQRDRTRDWVSFLGASYFRSAGARDQYGLSARGVAINTGLSKPEEFPRFTSFWIEQGGGKAPVVTVYALLDGPSLAGAYRIAMRREDGVVMAVSARLHVRTAIERLGIAPLTSMFWFSKHNRNAGNDWRPQVHDSNGLELWTGTGERVWRPLNNPPSVQTNAFVDDNPRGFGLMQRDRDFRNYQDDGVFYERRPSVWVEPLGDWGAGAVQLLEIPTDDEIHDNIGAYWVPEQAVEAGSRWGFDYRLHWLDDTPYPGDIGRTVATRTGRGGTPGQPRPDNTTKFVIDFEGGGLGDLDRDRPVAVAAQASRGEIAGEYCLRVVGTRRWRAVFDVAAQGEAPVDLRGYLRLGDRALTETWLYQHFPA